MKRARRIEELVRGHANVMDAYDPERRIGLVAVELAENSHNLFEAEYPDRPCFLIGAELEGVPQPLLDEAALVVQIPQWGLVPSLNMAVAGSIVLYDHLAKLHRANRLDRPDGGLYEEPL